MRCPKCGFFSFDYLNQCSKCQTDLTRERTSLNLLEIRPDPLSLKVIMDRVSQKTKPEVKPEMEREGSQPQPVVEPERSLGEGLSLDSPIALNFGFTPLETQVPPKPELVLGEGLSLDTPISLDLGIPLLETQIPLKENTEIELFLEGLEFTPSPKIDN